MQASLYIKRLAPCTKSVAESNGKYLLSIIWLLVRKRLPLNRELVMTEVVNKGSLEIWQFCYKNATERSLDKCKTNWYTELKLKGSSSPASAERFFEGFQFSLHSRSQSTVYQLITVLFFVYFCLRVKPILHRLAVTVFCKNLSRFGIISSNSS